MTCTQYALPIRRGWAIPAALIHSGAILVAVVLAAALALGNAAGQIPSQSVQAAADNQLDAFLAQQLCRNCRCLYANGQPSPLTGTAPAFDAGGAQFRVDERLIVAIAGQETGFGFHTGCQANHNAFNWFWCYSGRAGCRGNPVKYSPFADWQAGIGTVSKFMRKNYLQRGYTNVGAIGAKYCTQSCSGWIGGVTSILSRLGGDPNEVEQP